MAFFRGERFHIDLSDSDDDLQHRSATHDAVAAAGPTESEISPPPQSLFNVVVADIQERPVNGVKPPAPPPAPDDTTAGGFPAHKRRDGRTSAFRRARARREEGERERQQQREGSRQSITTAGSGGSRTRVGSGKIGENAGEKQSIEEENRQRIEAMGPEQVAREREELLDSMPPSLIERFLRRANIDDEHGREETKEKEATGKKKGTKSVSFDIADAENASKWKGKGNDTERTTAAVNTTTTSTLTAPVNPPFDTTGMSDPDPYPDLDTRPPPAPPADLFPASTGGLPPLPPSVHFPKPPRPDATMPTLDPDSPSFLADLQRHYFPDTPHDPAALSWLTDPNSPAANVSSASPTGAPSPYAPASAIPSASTPLPTAIRPSALRFSFDGALLPPSTALRLPSHLGLHHHAADPAAAGYTVPELATLSRSAMPAQRCLAWRVLGLLLFRLGRGEFGVPGIGSVTGTTGGGPGKGEQKKKEGEEEEEQEEEAEDTGELAAGLWRAIESEGVVAGMMTEANGGSGGASLTPAQRAARIGRHASARAWAVEALWLWRRGGGAEAGRGLGREGVVQSK